MVCLRDADVNSFWGFYTLLHKGDIITHRIQMGMEGKSEIRGVNSAWSREEDKIFETALALYDQETPDRWQKVATMVGGKSEDEVKRHYDVLVEDLIYIESDRVPLPNYVMSAEQRFEQAVNADQWPEERRLFLRLNLNSMLPVGK